MAYINKITISGFKSIKEPQSIKVKPMTVISGTNSAGKSSFMQPMLLIKQSIDTVRDTGFINLNGDNVKFNSVGQIFSNVGGVTSKGFSVSFLIENGFFTFPTEHQKELKIVNSEYTVECTYAKSDNIGLAIDSVSISTIEDKKCTVKNNNKDLPERDVSFLGETGVLGHFYQIVSQSKNTEYKGKWNAVPRKCFLNVEYSVGRSPINTGMNLCEAIDEWCTKLIHLPGLRGNPERVYDKSVVVDIFPGRFEKYTASIIYSWIQTGKKKSSREKLQKLKKYLALLDLASNVEAKYVDDTNLEILVSKLPVKNPNGINSDNLVSIADVGFGVSQSLPILVALLEATKGQPVYIEQPEIHLHPRAQANLVKPLIDAANRGVIVIVETHSSILLRAIQTAVAKEELPRDKVSLNWFTRDDNGCTKINSDCLDEFGAFGEWPVDFDEVYFNSENEYLDAVEARYEKNKKTSG